MNDYIAVRHGRSERRIALTNFFQGQNHSADGGVLPVTTAKTILNFDFSSGALTDGYGIKDFALSGKSITNVWSYSRYDFDKCSDEAYLMYSTKDGEVFYCDDDGDNAKVLEGISFSGAPFAVNYRLYGEDVILMCSENEGMFVWNGVDAAYKVEDAPNITSLALHYERLFVTVGDERNTVRFSDDLDPTNWGTDLTEGGFIQMLDERGKLNKVISFLNYVYIFRDYGVSRLTAYADQSEFSATNLYISSGRIYPHSVVACGDTVLFMASDGLYRFDGVGTYKMLSQLGGLVSGHEKSFAAYHDGKYFVTVNIKTDEGLKEGILTFDLKNGTHILTQSISAERFCVIGDKLIAVLSDGRVGETVKCGSVFDEPTQKLWRCGMQDFGTDKIKTVKEFYADTDTEFTLKVITENKEKSFKVPPAKGLSRLRVNMSGRQIGFEITVEKTGARISRPGFIVITR